MIQCRNLDHKIGPNLTLQLTNVVGMRNRGLISYRHHATNTMRRIPSMYVAEYILSVFVLFLSSSFYYKQSAC